MGRVKKSVHVSSHYRSTPSGGRTHVDSYTRKQRVNRNFDSSNSGAGDPRDARVKQSQSHPIEYMGKTRGKWSKPDLEDFGIPSDVQWDELTEEEKMNVASHYLISTSGFPPEDFSDLKLPVVDPDGNLNKNAVDNADSRLNQVHGLSDSERDGVQRQINRIQCKRFNE